MSKTYRLGLDFAGIDINGTMSMENIVDHRYAELIDGELHWISEDLYIMYKAAEAEAEAESEDKNE